MHPVADGATTAGFPTQPIRLLKRYEMALRIVLLVISPGAGATRTAGASSIATLMAADTAGTTPIAAPMAAMPPGAIGRAEALRWHGRPVVLHILIVRRRCATGDERGCHAGDSLNHLADVLIFSLLGLLFDLALLLEGLRFSWACSSATRSPFCPMAAGMPLGATTSISRAAALRESTRRPLGSPRARPSTARAC